MLSVRAWYGNPELIHFICFTVWSCELEEFIVTESCT